MCSAFNIWCCGQEKKIKNYLYFYKYDSIMTGYICRHFHVPCMLKLSPKFWPVSCVSTRGGVWCGSEGWERTTGLVSHHRTGVPWLFIWVVVRLQEWPRALIETSINTSCQTFSVLTKPVNICVCIIKKTQLNKSQIKYHLWKVKNIHACGCVCVFCRFSTCVVC